MNEWINEWRLDLKGRWCNPSWCQLLVQIELNYKEILLFSIMICAPIISLTYFIISSTHKNGKILFLLCKFIWFCLLCWKILPNFLYHKYYYFIRRNPCSESWFYNKWTAHLSIGNISIFLLISHWAIINSSMNLEFWQTMNGHR